jgi:hypothetical protein
MLRFTIVFCLHLIPILGNSQEIGMNDFIGHYTGEMQLINQDKNSYNTVLVTLDIHEIKKDSIWSYIMTYNSQTYGSLTKDYEIQLTKEGGFQIDEKNGIVILMSFIDGCIYEFFESEEMYFNVTMRKRKKNILFELTGSPKWNKREVFLATVSPLAITSYGTTVVQKATLNPTKSK